MATLRTGPLINTIHGSIGGVTHQTSGGAVTARARTSRCQPHPPRQSATNNLLARGAVAWSSLTDADRVLWTRAAQTISVVDRAGNHRHVKPFQLYLSCYSRQSGLPAPEDPNPPNLIGRADPVDILTATFQEALVTNALSRDLESDENCVVRVLRQMPARIAKPLHRVHNTFHVESDEGLGIVPDLCVKTGPPISYATGATAGIPLTSHTIELWVYPLWPQPDDRAIVINYSNLLNYIDLYRDGNSWYVNAPNYYNIGPAPAPYQWIYLAIVVDTTGPTVSVYKNAELWCGPYVFNAFASGDPVFLAVQDAVYYRFHGYIDDVRFSNVARTPAELSAIYNNGVPKQMLVDGNTTCLLRCNELYSNPGTHSPPWTFDPSRLPPGGGPPPMGPHPIFDPGTFPSYFIPGVTPPFFAPLHSTDYLLDSTPNDHDFVAYNLTLDAGVHSRVLYAAADRILPSPCAIWTDTQALNPDALTALSRRKKTEW